MKFIDYNLDGIVGLGAKIGIADISELKHLEKNANVMKFETFDRLKTNISQDGGLTSVPLVMKIPGDDKYEIISGNHRVEAGVKSGQEKFLVLVTDTLEEAKKVAIQISHNAIAGEDDPAILKQLYESIQDIDLKTYCGLDDKMLDLLDQIKPESIGEANLAFQTLSFIFLPDEIEKVKEVWEEACKLITADAIWRTRWKNYDKLLSALDTAGKSYDVSNVSTQLELILQVFEKNLPDTCEGWYESSNLSLKHKNPVPLASVLGTYDIPASFALELKKVIAKAIQEGELQKEHPWEILKRLIPNAEGK